MKRNKEDIKNKISFKSKIGIITIKADESGIKELLLSDILNKHVPEYETALYEADCDMMQVQSSGTVSFLLNEAKKHLRQPNFKKRSGKH